MPDDFKPPSDHQRIRILEIGHMHLTEQMAELVIGMQSVQTSMKSSGVKLTSIEGELQTNSETTGEVRDILRTVKGGLKMLSWMGTAVRMIGYLAAAGAAIYSAWHMATHGGKPPGVE